MLKIIHPASSNLFHQTQDGIDHINIYSKAKTKLGKLLSNFSNTPFTFEGYNFLSVEGCLYFYRTSDERFLNLYGSAAKRLGSKLKHKKIETPAIVAKWIRAKVYSNPMIIDLILQNNLPYSHYYIMFGKKVDAGLELPDLWRDLTNELKFIFEN